MYKLDEEDCEVLRKIFPGVWDEDEEILADDPMEVDEDYELWHFVKYGW